MELCRENGSQRKACLCILHNLDDDDVVMHDADCSYCDGDFLETAFLEDNVFDSGSCLTFDDLESDADEGGNIKVRAEEKVTVKCQEVVDVKCKPVEKVIVKRVVLEDKEARLDQYIAALKKNNTRLLQRFHEVQEDKKRAERRDEDWKRKKRTTDTISLRVRFSLLSGHRSVSLVEKQRKRSRGRNRER